MRTKNAVTGRVLLAVVVCALAVAVGGVASSSGAQKPASKPAKQPAFAAKLTQSLPVAMKENAVPGIALLIDSPSKGNWRWTFGTAEIGKQVPMKMSDLFRIGSNTKTMTSTVILQLVEEGKLKLNDPIGKFVPGVPNGKKITIRELAEMRSGLYSYTFDRGFNETLDRQPKKAWKSSELLKIAFSHKPNFAPGAEYEYSNTNIALLGVVIEKLTGETASEAFQERIFGPLKMKHSSLPEPSEWKIPGPHAQGYQFGTNVATIDSYAVPKAEQAAALDGSLLPIDYTDASPSWAWTAGGAISTPAELATYAKALGTGKGLLSPKMQKVRLNSLRPIVPGAKSPKYGIGLAEFAPGIVGHDGQIPGYSSFMAYDIETGDTIILATNLAASPVTGENAAVELAKVIIATLYGAGDVPGGNPAAANN
ncbi:MAG: beta-lactamase family protein [Actinobacteria bacterium]|nr:beta-lactamase family protein [Actinomycetota bacterium]